MSFGEETLLETSFWGEQTFCSETNFKQGKRSFWGTNVFRNGFLEKFVRNKLFQKETFFRNTLLGNKLFQKTVRKTLLGKNLCFILNKLCGEEACFRNIFVFFLKQTFGEHDFRGRIFYLETNLLGEPTFCLETSFKQGKNKVLGNKLV